MPRASVAAHATGENRTSARFSGIPTRTLIVAAFAICGMMACLSITLLVASSGANVTAGNQLLMPAFAAVYLGAAPSVAVGRRHARHADDVDHAQRLHPARHPHRIIRTPSSAPC